MSKRFTATDKWDDPWFRNLPQQYQRFWIYILDRCDQSGVWKEDFESIKWHLKEDLDKVILLKYFNTGTKIRINEFKSGYWFVPDFLDFQYGDLSTACKPHNYVLGLLKKHKIKGYPKGSQTLKDKDKDQDKDKDKDKDSIISGHPSLFDLKTFFKNDLMAQDFYDYFSSNGWKVGGRAPMKDWQAAARRWKRNTGFNKNRVPQANHARDTMPDMKDWEKNAAPPPKEVGDLIKTLAEKKSV